MCKENEAIHAVSTALIRERVAENRKGNFRIMRKGKTRRDKLTGAWANRLANRSQRAEENKRFHNKHG